MDTDPFYSESNMKALRESVQQAREGKVIVKTMEELERMAEEVESVSQRMERRQQREL